MSEESKIDSDYVYMDHTRPGTGNTIFKAPAGLDDPNLTQEERDLRLAIALQQQENAQAQAVSGTKLKNAEKADIFRTGRSGVNTRLANVRDKDHGMLKVPKDYNNDSAYVSADYLPPSTSTFTGTAQEMADHQLAVELHRMEATGVGAGVSAEKMLKKEKEIDEAQAHRTGRSNVPPRPGAMH